MTDSNDSALHTRRLARRDSLAELTRLCHRAYRPLLAQGLHYRAATQSRWSTWRRTRGGECFVTVAGERLVGTITLMGPGRVSGAAWYRRPDVASFHMLAVDPDYQGRGIAAMLLDRVECRAVELGAAELALDTAESARQLIDMYQRRGYRIVEQVSWQTRNYRSVILSRTLAPLCSRSGAPPAGT
jgi:ribosomal protein S18 acetylase RimI-like enzyme